MEWLIQKRAEASIVPRGKPRAQRTTRAHLFFLFPPQGGEELLVLINAENNQPEVIVPPGPFIVNEDEEISISGARVTDIDMQVSANYELAVRLSVEQGVVSLSSSDGLSFSVGDGVEDQLVYFHGSATHVGDALESITYRGHLNWWVFLLFLVLAYTAKLNYRSPCVGTRACACTISLCEVARSVGECCC